MTSSKYLRSRLKSGIAFPIMLAAVGLLLASLALGLGTNLTQALGEKEGGICGYSDLMREAILANNKDRSYDCDRAVATTDPVKPAYVGADPSWGGTTGVANNGHDVAKDLDLTNKGISEFAPGKGELDGFVRGSRVDLRGNGLAVADLDVSAATGSFTGTYTDAAGTEQTYPAYSRFGASIGAGSGTSRSPAAQPTGLGLTFLLDGGSTTSSGLALDTYEGTEGDIAWITFEYGDVPKAASDLASGRDGGAWLRVRFTISTDAVDGSNVAIVDTVDALISTADPKGTLYAIPYRIRDDSEIQKTQKEDVAISLFGIGDFATVVGLTAAQTTEVPTFTPDIFLRAIERENRESDLFVLDEDAPAVSVRDRHDAVAEQIAEFLGISEKDVGVDHLAGNVFSTVAARNTEGLTSLSVGRAVGPSEDKIESIAPDDLSGLTGLTALNLNDNSLTELPSGLFADVGTKVANNGLTIINVRGNPGPDGDGFMLSNVGVVGEELSAGQVLKVTSVAKDDRDTGRIGFLQNAYEGTEGDVLVVDVNIRTSDASTAAIQFKTLDGDSGNVTNANKAKDVNSEFVDLRSLGSGNFRIAIGLPENKDEDNDNTVTAIFGRAGQTGTDPITTITTILDIVPVTIRDVSYEAAPDVPAVPESSFESVVVTQNEFVEAPGNEDLKHNISNFTVTVGGNAVNANFLDVYNATGSLERWGYPTSEVVEIPGIGLTQFFQRGALHLAGNESVTRLLAWDYVGGGLGGSVDQQVEAAPESAPEGGEQVGAFGHYVANVDADGNATGFLDFFTRLGGVDAFGFPKTEARADTGADGTLMEPGTTAGFTRQYFQAAVFQLAEDGSVQLTLLGDTLRGILVPGFADIDAFGAADALSVGDEVSPPVISS